MNTHNSAIAKHAMNPIAARPRRAGGLRSITVTDARDVRGDGDAHFLPFRVGSQPMVTGITRCPAMAGSARMTVRFSEPVSVRAEGTSAIVFRDGEVIEDAPVADRRRAKP